MLQLPVTLRRICAPGFALYMQIAGSGGGGESGGFTNEQSPQDEVFSGDLLDKKHPLFPGGGGVLKNMYIITESQQMMYLK